jgi:hypothetical protein
MRSLDTMLKYLVALASINGNDDTEGTGVVIDRAGSDALEFLLNVGVAGDTLSGAVKIQPVLQHGDLANGSDMAFVPDADLIGGLNDGAGGWGAVIDAAGKANKGYKVGYRGAKRYVRVFLDFTGTHTNGTPVSALAILGQLRYEGVQPPTGSGLALGATGI